MIYNKDGTPFTLERKIDAVDEPILHNFDPQIEQPVVINTTPEVPMVTVNCLPVHTTFIKDALYGENVKTSRYLQPLKINIYISKSTDVSFQFWTRTKVEKDSIIHQMKERRWWVIKEIQEKSGWYNYGCLPSTITPYFV